MAWVFFIQNNFISNLRAQKNRKKKKPSIKTDILPFYFLQEFPLYKPLAKKNNVWAWGGWTAYMVVLDKGNYVPRWMEVHEHQAV